MSSEIQNSFDTLKARSRIRKQLLAQSLGVDAAENLSHVLGTEERHHVTELSNNKASLPLPKSQPTEIPAAVRPTTSGSDPQIPVLVIPKVNSASSTVSGTSEKKKKENESESEEEMVVLDDYYKVLQEEEKVFKGSATFLKGTQSANPHNDYCQHYVDTGQRPQNFIRDPGLNERFEEYPKLKELIKLKDQLVSDTATPPMYLSNDLLNFDLHDLGSRFDVIMIEPPLQATSGMGNEQVWTWDMIQQLDIPAIAENRCFIWLWAGSTPEGTRRARQCVLNWGFRRCEDICWVKTNKNTAHTQQPEPNAILIRSKEHCLMGIRGTVRRSLDGDFIHANVDIDLIITDEPGPGEERRKPEEIFMLAEHFCLGKRRLHLFGRDDTLRPGWLTVGPDLASSNFDDKVYRTFFEKPGSLTTGCTERIEQLRPKSPERPGGPNQKGGPKPGGQMGDMKPPLRRDPGRIDNLRQKASALNLRRTESNRIINKPPILHIPAHKRTQSSSSVVSARRLSDRAKRQIHHNEGDRKRRNSNSLDRKDNRQRRRP